MAESSFVVPMDLKRAPPQTLQVQGRTISFRRVGQGKRKILFFHGFPGSSAQISPFLNLLESYDLDVICMDRPGYHRSERTATPQRQQNTEAIWDLVQSVGWTSCELMSVSGGTPFLFSFLQAHPDFVSKISIVSGLGPVANKEFQSLLSRKATLALKALPLLPPALIEKIFPSVPSPTKSAQAKLLMIRFFLPASTADLKSVRNLRAQQVLMQSLREAFWQRGLGPQKDAQEYMTPWNLQVDPYQGPIDIWHGGEDRILPVRMAEQLSRALPGSRLHILEGEGHYSLALNHIEKVLKGT